MIIRRIVIILNALVIIVGLSQVVAASWWADVIGNLVGSRWLVAFGVIALFYGGMLLVAVADRQVGWRLFVGIIGVISMAGAVILLAAPDLARDLISALITQRSHAFQILLISVSGLARMAIGALILFAVARRPIAQPTNRMPPMR